MRSLLVLFAAWVTCASVGLAQTSASVGTAPALNWVRLAGAESCADSVEVARRIESHLGRRVFWSASDAEESIEAVVEHESGVWTLALHVQSRDGSRGQRRLESRSPECAALIEDAIVVIAALIDPQHDPGATRIAPEVDGTLERAFGAEPTDPDPETLTAPGPQPAIGHERAASIRSTGSSSPAATASAHSDPLRLRASLATFGALGRLPGMGAGFAAGLTLAPRGMWSLQLELMGLLPKTEAVEDAGGRVTFSRLDSRLRLCPLDTGRWALCSGGGVGIVLGSASGFVHTRQLSPALGADLDVHARYRLPLSSDLSLTLGANVSIALQRPELVFRTEASPLAPTELYSTPVLAGHLAVGAEIDL